MIVETARLRLRPLTEDDTEPLVAMLTDPEVTRYVTPSPIVRASAEALATHYRRRHEERGYGWCALEIREGSAFAGIVLLQDVEFEAAFTPAIEVGWLLARGHWGYGYATEGARGALDYAFTTINLAEVVAITAIANLRSRAVMERLGMTHDVTEDFDHPHVRGTPLERGMLYRIRNGARM